MKLRFSLSKNWWRKFGLLTVIATTLLLLHFFGLYWNELTGKTIPSKYYLKLALYFTVVFLPLAILCAILITQLITWRQPNKKTIAIAAMFRMELVPAILGSILFFSLVAYIVPIVHSPSYALLYNIRNALADPRAPWYLEPTCHVYSHPATNLHELIQLRAIQNQRDRKEFVQYLANVDFVVANRILNPDNIRFFNFSDSEVIQMRTTSKVNVLRPDSPELEGYFRINLTNQIEQDRNRKANIYIMILSPLLFLFVYLIVPTGIVLINRHVRFIKRRSLK